MCKIAEGLKPTGSNDIIYFYNAISGSDFSMVFYSYWVDFFLFMSIYELVNLSY